MRRFLLSIVMLFTVTAIAAAQGAPDQIHVALERLSGVVNRNLTLNDLQDWRWSQDVYGDTSLGCPQPDTMYAQVSTVGLTFLLTYQDTVYDYRVSGDATIAFLCGQTSRDAQATSTATEIPANAFDAHVLCTQPEAGIIYPSTRLTTDIQARTPNGINWALQSQPGDAGAPTGTTITSNAIFTVVVGPVCADGRQWWQVDYDGVFGWLAETQTDAEGNITRNAEPVPGLALPLSLPVLTADNVTALREYSRTENAVAPRLALAPNSDTVAVTGSAAVDGVWLYMINALQDVPVYLEGDETLTSIDYAPDGSRLLLGDAEGGIRLWATEADTPLRERWYDRGHETATTAAIFSPDGQTIASTADTTVTRATDQKENVILLWDVERVAQRAALVGHTAPVNALAFSPDGALLASASDDMSVRLWDPATGAGLATLTEHSAPIVALAFSPDGTQLAAADTNGSIHLWDITSRSRSATLSTTDSAAITDVTFNPDGTLLAGGTQTGALVLWDIATQAQLAQYTVATEATPLTVRFSHNGAILIVAGDDHTLRFWGAAQAS